MNALELLKNDHQKVNDLFEQLQQASEFDQKLEVLEMIRDVLTLHAFIEETIFYPTFKDIEGFEDMIEAGSDEHAEIKDLLDEIDSLDDEMEVEDRVYELQEAVDYHIDEHENEFFPKIRRIMGEPELEALGEKLLQGKQTLGKAA